MMRANILLSACLAVMLLTGAVWKGLDRPTPAPAPDRTGHAIETAFRATGLHAAGRRQLTDEGDFIMSGFIDRRCPDGGLLVLPLRRNAEGARLLVHVTGNPNLKPAFLLDGKLHATFPSARFWWQRVHAKLSRLIGGSGRPPIVLAVGEVGPCQLASQIEWQGLQTRLGTALAAR